MAAERRSVRVDFGDGVGFCVETGMIPDVVMCILWCCASVDLRQLVLDCPVLIIFTPNNIILSENGANSFLVVCAVFCYRINQNFLA